MVLHCLAVVSNVDVVFGSIELILAAVVEVCRIVLSPVLVFGGIDIVLVTV